MRHLIRREVRSDRVEQRDRGSYGLLVSWTALAFVDPKHWNLAYAMAHLFKAFEKESLKLGKRFDEMVRRRRRELGLAVPPEERILPFRSPHLGSRPALDITIDREPDRQDLADTVSLLRLERRLEELDVALENAQQRCAPASTLRRLEQAFEQELRTYDTLVSSRTIED